MKPLREWSLRVKITLHLLIIFLLIIAHLVGIWWFPQEVKQDGAAINEAGEQRMLTQLMAAEAHQIGMDDDKSRDELAASAAEFDRTLAALIEGNETMGLPPAPPEVREQLRTVQAAWDPFYAHVQTVVENPRTSQEFHESLAYIEANNEQLLVESDRAVQRYEQAYEAKIRRTQQFFFGLLALDILVIPLLLIFIHRHILRPVTRITHDAETIASGDFDQPITAVDSINEMGRLSRSLQEMKDQLVSTVQEIERFEQAVEHAGHAIYITDTDGTIEYVNSAFEEITKYSESQALGNTPRILKSGEQAESYYEEVWETVLSGDVWEDDMVNKRASGEQFHAHQTIAPITGSDGEIQGFVAIMADNTKQLVNAQQNQVLSRVMRHNLRTELNLIDGYAQELANTDEFDTRTDYVNEIRRCVNRLVKLSDMAERSIRACQQEASQQPQGICAAIERVCAAAREQQPQATITADTPDYEIDILGNIELVLDELVENAIEHNDCVTPKVHITATLREEQGPPPMVRIEVTDNGPGVPANERRVLEKGEETALFHGSGLGLWLVHWLVTLAGGQVTIRGRSPRGTCVVLTLPRASVSTFPRTSTGYKTDAPESINNSDNDTNKNND